MADEELGARIDKTLDKMEALIKDNTLDKIDRYVARRIAEGEPEQAVNADANRRLQEYIEMLRD